MNRFLLLTTTPALAATDCTDSGSSGDDPAETDDAPAFGPSAEVTVNAGETTEANL